MAKADFCFNFYDGDATRDMAHMNRLERGAYMDVVIQQRQRGSLSLDDLKKFLSKDFDAVWPALEWVLKKDDAGKFFIEWLVNSMRQSAKHAERQSQNATKHKPKTKTALPLGDGDGSGDGSRFKKNGEPDAHLQNWREWGDQIVRGEDFGWDNMHGRQVGPGEMKTFLSVATRNKWTMDSQQAFRVALDGFDSKKGTNGTAKEKAFEL